MIVDDNASFVTIPERTKFVSNSKSLNNFSFYTNETYVVSPTNGEYISEEISLYEGILTTEKYFINQNIKFYKIQNENVDLETLKVYVKSSSGNTVEYKRTDSLYIVDISDLANPAYVSTLASGGVFLPYALLSFLRHLSSYYLYQLGLLVGLSLSYHSILNFILNNFNVT